MTPATLSTLKRAFDRLDSLLPDVRNVVSSDEGVILSYGESVGCRGYYEIEWESIQFSWEEWVNEKGDHPSLETLAHDRWQKARWEREEVRRKTEAEQKERDRITREQEKRLAPARKEAAERAKLAELLTKYGTTR